MTQEQGESGVSTVNILYLADGTTHTDITQRIFLTTRGRDNFPAMQNQLAEMLSERGVHRQCSYYCCVGHCSAMRLYFLDLARHETFTSSFKLFMK